MRHFSSAFGWDVNLGCLLFELCLIFETKKIKLGSSVKFRLRSKSLRGQAGLQLVPVSGLELDAARGETTAAAGH